MKDEEKAIKECWDDERFTPTYDRLRKLYRRGIQRGREESLNEHILDTHLLSEIYQKGRAEVLEEVMQLMNMVGIHHDWDWFERQIEALKKNKR